MLAGSRNKAQTAQWRGDFQYFLRIRVLHRPARSVVK